jgi:hypothetical protein
MISRRETHKRDILAHESRLVASFQARILTGRHPVGLGAALHSSEGGFVEAGGHLLWQCYFQSRICGPSTTGGFPHRLECIGVSDLTYGDPSFFAFPGKAAEAVHYCIS